MNKPRASAVAMWVGLLAVVAVVVFIGVRVAQNQAADDREDARRDQQLAEVIKRLDGARGEREALLQLVDSLELNLRESNRRLKQAGEPIVPVPKGAGAEPERQDAELQEPERQDPEPDDPERQQPEVQEREFQNPELMDGEPDDAETQDEEIQDAETDDPETQDAEEQEPETQDPEIQDPEIQDEETQEPENQEPETQDPEINDPDPVDDPDPDTPNPPASLTFNFGPPMGALTCTRSGGTDADPAYDCA